MTLYTQSRATLYKDVWLKVLHRHYIQTTFPFANYIFRINGMVYTEATPEWHAALARLNVWETLRK